MRIERVPAPLKQTFPPLGVFTMVPPPSGLRESMVINNGTAPRTLRSLPTWATLRDFTARTGTNLLRFLVTAFRAPRVAILPWERRDVIIIAATVVAIVLFMVVVDVAAIEWAKGLPSWFHGWADEITDFGRSGWFLYPLGFGLIAVAAAANLTLPRQAYGLLAFIAARAGFLFVAIGLPSLFATIIKRMIGRARPYVGGADDPFVYYPFIWRPEYASMPSGHATTAAAAAIAIGAIWPRLRPVMWVYAVIIMLTRVIIGVHHPSDVLAGALVGVVGAFLVQRWYAQRRLVFYADLRPMPGPSRRRLAKLMRDVRAAVQAN